AHLSTSNSTESHTATSRHALSANSREAEEWRGDTSIMALRREATRDDQSDDLRPDRPLCSTSQNADKPATETRCSTWLGFSTSTARSNCTAWCLLFLRRTITGCARKHCRRYTVRFATRRSLQRIWQ